MKNPVLYTTRLFTVSIAILCFGLVFVSPFFIGRFYHNLGLIALANFYTSKTAESLPIAQQFLESAVDYLPDRSSRFWLGTVYQLSGDQQYASETWQEIADFAISKIVAQGDVASRYGDFSDAQYFYELIRKINPQYSTADFKLGILYYTFNQSDIAFRYLSQALDLGNFQRIVDLAVTHYTIGSIFAKRTEWQSAIVHAEDAIHANPQFADAHLLLGNSHYSLKAYSNAYDAYAAIIALEPERFEARYKMGLTCMALGLTDEAVVHLEQAVKVYHADPWLFLAMGDAYSGANNMEKAVNYYEKVIELAPNDRVADVARQYLNVISSKH